MPNKIQILIQNGDIIYEPIVEEGVEWQTERKGVPGKLSFNVLADHIINFTEGNIVRMSVNGTNVFYGYVFTKKRNKDGIIAVTAYDQLRYLKNKDCIFYENETASQLVEELAKKYLLKIGTIEDTEYIIPQRIEDNKTLFDVIQTALDLTLTNKKKMYVLYDDFGKLTLKNIESMLLNYYLDGETAEDFDYKTSIDSNTYNQIKLTYENSETGKREIYMTKDSAHIKDWGLLQYYEKIESKNVNPYNMADALLGMLNKRTRNLSISNAFGDIRVRGGTSIIVNLNLGDMKLEKYMLVEKVKHVFKDNEHMMNLTLMGDGEFVA